MDYSQLSDFEINKLVGIALGKEIMPDDCQDFGLSGFPEVMLRNGDFKDYCNDPNDAWPIIESRLICLAADVFAEPHDGGKWVAQPAYGWEKERVRSDNPLRAAMIVFLMMQDAKHA